ncbi:MAG TPA: DUF6531 domain-containing protein [Nitrospiraceae bacterium]|nr:DUF6531 domain-containing protein [Nitrospiraceae bacterium]
MLWRELHRLGRGHADGAGLHLLASGQLAVESTDLVLPGRIPVVIRRAYRSQDVGAPPEFIPTRALVNGNAFGSNTALVEYDDRLQGSGQVLQYADPQESHIREKMLRKMGIRLRMFYGFGLVITTIFAIVYLVLFF